MCLSRWVVSFVVTASLFTCLNAVGQSGSPQTDGNKAAEQFAALHQAWGAKASTPGASLTIQESTRAGQVIKFHLVAAGLPKDGVYTLLSWPVTQKGPVEALKGVTLDSSGLAICAGTPTTCGSADKPNDPIDLSFQPVAGEPFRVALVSADGAAKALAKVVPVPLRGEDGECRVEATLLTPGAELVLVEGSGFPANAAI